jgi:bacteriocin biosynthesis cyclodehydratase domain-containing protein
MTTRYVLAPGRPVLLRPDGAVQVGWDPRRAVLIRPPGSMTQPQLADLLHTLQGGASRDELATAATQFGGPEAVDELIAGLTDAGVVTLATPHPSRTPTVRIHGRGPLSELLTGALRCSGALVRHTSRPHASAVPDATDLVVLADYQVTEPRVLRELHEAAVAHLPVRLRDGTGLVGPLVIPGLTSCLHCADLHRSERDAAWPALAAQLRGTVGTAGRATILATAALALRQIELVIQAVREAGDPRRAPQPPPTLDTTLELDADGYSISARRWSRHPDCPC